MRKAQKATSRIGLRFTSRSSRSSPLPSWQMLLPPQGLTFPCWEVSTQLLHKVLGNGGRGHLNVLHERHLPYGREHGWHGERVVAHATQQLRRL